MEKSDNPFSIPKILIQIFITIIAGVIVAFLVQDGRFAPPPSSTPSQDQEVTPMVTSASHDSPDMSDSITETDSSSQNRPQVIPSPTAFTVADANAVTMVNVDGDCDYFVWGLTVFSDNTGERSHGQANDDGTVTWDLSLLPSGVIIGDAVMAEIDGNVLSGAANDPGVTFYITSPNPDDRRTLRLREGKFRIVPPQSGEGKLRLVQRNLECRGTYQSVVRYPSS